MVGRGDRPLKRETKLTIKTYDDDVFGFPWSTHPHAPRGKLTLTALGTSGVTEYLYPTIRGLRLLDMATSRICKDIQIKTPVNGMS